MNRTGFVRALLVLALALTLAACSGAAVRQSPPKSQPVVAPVQVQQPIVPTGPMRVAVLVPLTGDFAPIGQQLVNAAALAVFEDQQTPFELLPFDTNGTVDGAVAAAAKARQQNVDLIIGPLFGKTIPQVRQALGPNPVPILTFTNDTDQAGAGVFVLGLGIEEQVRRMTDFLASDARLRLLVFGPNTPYTRRVLAAFQPGGPAGHVQLVRSALFEADADFNSIAAQVKVLTDYDRRRASWHNFSEKLVAKLRTATDPALLLETEAATFPPESVTFRMLGGMATVYRQHLGRGANAALQEVIAKVESVDAAPADDFDAILLPFANDNLIAVGSMLDLYNAGQPFARVVGTSVWQQEDLAKEPSFHHAWYTAADRTAQQPFVQSYQTTFQAVPESIAILGYYAAKVALAAANANARPVTASFIQRPSGFQSQGGTIQFDATNIIRSPLSVYEVTPSGPIEAVIQPRPTS
jgi:ABC-type branched-subunit amino acid transport system substrate-binding protein